MAHGGKREGAGRKPKADEQELIEKLSPLMPKAYKALSNALDEEEPWATKLAMEYFYGKPKQSVQSEVKLETKGLPDWVNESKPELS